jgi:hypothetical protein
VTVAAVVRRAFVLAGAAGLAAVAAEVALRQLPAEDRPFSGPVRPSVEIDAPIEDVWAVVADIPGQIRWMPEMKQVTLLTDGPVGKGSVGEATVRIFGISVTDQVTITTFQPPTAFGIEHDGLFGGGGRLDLRPGTDPATTVVSWEEALIPPLFPALGWLLGRPIIAALYKRDLFLLRDLVESGRASRDVAHPGED